MAKLLKKKELEKVNQMISNFEEKTHSELVIIINKKSDPYPGASLRFGVLMAFLVTVTGCLFFDTPYTFLIPLVFLFLIYLFSFIGRLNLIQKFTITKAEKNREVLEKAYEVFFVNGPNRTEHRATSVIYFSLLERKVHLIVDRAINRKLEQDDLKKVIEIIEDEFKQQNYFDGFETAIETLERLILYYFPTKVLEEKPTELPNQVKFL